MNINTFEEQIISVDEAAKHISKISGKKRNRHVILRWMNRGCSGVKLDSILIGGEIYTSREALNTFVNRSRQARTEKRSEETRQGIQRQRVSVDPQLEAQARELGI